MLHTHPVAIPTDAPLDARARAEILTPDALAFLGELHARFDPLRRTLLDARRDRRAALAAGGTLDFLDRGSDARTGDWQVAPPRPDYADRRVEITGPTDRKLVINALNSGARGFMADFEDANAPTWANQIGGQLNLLDAVERTISHTGPDGREYRLAAQTATLLVRPRGLHLDEHHLRVGDEPMSGAFVDFGLALLHLGHRQLASGSAPYFYLPKLEHHLEARLWNDVIVWAQEALGIPRGSVRATVLIETLPAAFQMEEILFELREHSYGLNAGRWDYIFSAIKCFRERAEIVLPDRADITMTVPFMRAYTELLVATCHRRGAFAMGGMAALVPARDDPEATERAVAAVRADKRREARMGFDGTWVAHPATVAHARAEFDAVLGDAQNQLARQPVSAPIGADDLLALHETPGAVTDAGVRGNVEVACRYLDSWLDGRGAVALHHLMEDAATAEIARTQLWQWVRHGVVTREEVERLLGEEIARLEAEGGLHPAETRELFARIVFADVLPEFLTVAGLDLLERTA